jgi:broad specificity phosphatase PhoE
MTTTIFIIRHGETMANREGMFRGQRDFPLNENGRIQAKAVAEDLRAYKIDAVYSGPLSRTVETARPLADWRGLPVVMEPGFTNISLGDWEGKPKKWVEENQPDLWKMWIIEPEKLRRPGAETLNQVQQRAFQALQKIIREQTGKTIAVVTHRAVLKPLIAACLQIPAPYFWKVHMDTAGYSVLEHGQERGFTLTLMNQTRHLKDFVREMV